MTYLTSVVNRRWDICYYATRAAAFLGNTLGAVSLLTLTAISLDRLLALLLVLRYRQVVTLKRMHITVIGFWILSIAGASTYFWNRYISSWCRYIVATLFLVTSIFAYTKISCTLRRNQVHVQNHVAQGQPNQTIPLNTAPYRKAVYSAMWVQLTLIVCYLPYGIAVALTPPKEISLAIYRVNEFTVMLVYLNSSLNPLLYCWKIREVRQAVKETLRQIFRWSS